jgi:hypothetical protein
MFFLFYYIHAKISRLVKEHPVIRHLSPFCGN